MIIIIITQYKQERNAEHIPYYFIKYARISLYFACYIIFLKIECISYKNMKLKKEEEFFYPIIENSSSFFLFRDFIFESAP